MMGNISSLRFDRPGNISQLLSTVAISNVAVDCSGWIKSFWLAGGIDFQGLGGLNPSMLAWLNGLSTIGFRKVE